MYIAKEIKFTAGEKVGKVSGLLILPKNAEALLVFAHGAGAGMRHKFMEEISAKLAHQGIGTLRYQFPYMERRSKRPDTEAVLTSTVRSAVATAKKHSAGLRLFAAGKSMGGRMTSLAAAKEFLPGVSGLIFLGFPLHAAGKPSAERGQHLFDVHVPMLFLQGSRDTLADLKLLQPLCGRLGQRAELFVVDGGDHSFHMQMNSERSDDQVLDDIVQQAVSWISRF